MFKVELSDPSELEELMDEAAYKKILESSEWKQNKRKIITQDRMWIMTFI